MKRGIQFSEVLLENNGAAFLNSKYAYLLTLKLISIIIATPDTIQMSVSTLHSPPPPLFLLGGRAKKKRRKRLKGFLVFSEGKKEFLLKMMAMMHDCSPRSELKGNASRSPSVLSGYPVSLSCAEYLVIEAGCRLAGTPRWHTVLPVQ